MAIDLAPYMDHLRQHYAQQTPIYWQLYRLAREEHAARNIASFGGERDDGTLTLAQLQRLMVAIRNEHRED